MKIFTTAQLHELDKYTIEHEPVASIDLMERAARALTTAILDEWTKLTPVIVLAGPGNNGGDALAVARMLADKDFNVSVYLFNVKNQLSDECITNRKRIEDDDRITFTEVSTNFDPPKLTADTLVIDGLFGSGLNKPLAGGFASLVRYINSSPCQVVSIDMPSGLMCEDNTYNSPSAIVRATHTLTIGLPKLALILADNQIYAGQTHVLSIGLCLDKLDEMCIPYQITERADVAALVKARPAFGHKGTFGNALLVAGKYGMAGAAVLAARACLKSGVGKVTVHTPLKNNDILQMAVPEAVLDHDEDERIFTNPVRTDFFQALAIGPGIGTDKRTALAFIEQTSHTDIPLVIDADGINILGSHKGWIPQIPANAIFTPHPKEMQHLGICNTDSYSTLLEAVNMAKQHKFFICLKGHYTAVCTPDGQVCFNPTGNSGMATAGSGDVLTGIILALLAQQYTPEEACKLGVYWHGLAGDMAAADMGEHGVTASDIINYLPKALLSIKAGA